MSQQPLRAVYPYTYSISPNNGGPRVSISLAIDNKHQVVVQSIGLSEPFESYVLEYDEYPELHKLAEGMGTGIAKLYQEAARVMIDLQEDHFYYTALVMKGVKV